jgi:hypothetical protein
VQEAYVEAPDFTFLLAGDWPSSIESPAALTQLGTYDSVDSLASKLADSLVDWVLFTSAARETYSHALTDVLKAVPLGAKLMLPDLQLWRERTRGRAGVNFYRHEDGVIGLLRQLASSSSVTKGSWP